MTLLANADATRENVLAALADLAARATPDDTVLLFYSGHGDYSADGVYHLTTNDTRLAQGRVVAGTGIGQPELLDRLRALPVRRLVLLINTCHAGELSPVLGEGNHPFTGQPLPQQAADALLATGSGRIIITACRENQVAYIGPGPITIFAQALTDGLRGQGLNARAGYISVFDLYTHLYFAVGEAVEKRVSAALRQRYGNTQEPELTVLKGVGPFPIALYRGSTMLGDFPTDHTPPEETALREVLPARSRWAFQQSTGGAGNVAIGGSVSDGQIIIGSNNTVFQAGRDTIQSGGDTITVGDVSGTGIAIGRRARADVQQGGDQESLDRVFAPVYAAIAARPADPEVDKEEVTALVRRIQHEAQQGERANEQQLTRRLRALAAMAEDIFAVTVSMLTDPQTTVATVARRAAAKVQQEREAPGR